MQPPTLPNEFEMQLAAESSRVLAQLLADDGSNTFELKIKDGKEVAAVNIPASALKMLFSILTQMSRGNAVTLIPINAELTTQEAANILNVSRPFLIGLLEENKIPYRKVGTRRKILFTDIMQYKETMYHARLRTLEELAAEGQALEKEFEELNDFSESDDSGEKRRR